MPDPTRGSKWRRSRAICLARSNICHLCGEPIDLALSGRHPWGPVVDHIVSLYDGGAMHDQANLAPAHRRCNIIKENRLRHVRRHKPRLNTTQQW